MANKYIRHGVAFCGDGTTSATASSNGAAGAWNNINVLEGTAPAYGALVAGDTVYIRSKDNADANITRTLTANINFGSSAASDSSPITWVLDGGTIWAGISGTLTYNCPGNFLINGVNSNRYFSEIEDLWAIVETSTNSSYKNYLGGISIHIKNLLIDLSVVTSGNGSQLANYNGTSILENLHIKSRRRPEHLIRVGGYSKITVIGVNIELLDATQTTGVFVVAGAGGSMDIIGGAVSGAGATTGVRLFETLSQGSVTKIVGLQFPQTMSAVPTISNPETAVYFTGSDGLVGARVFTAWGESNSRTDAYYPTLNATLPDSNSTPWSWWLYPKSTTPMYAATLPLAKIYSETAAIKNIDLEVLVATTFSAVDRSKLWIDVCYTDAATGLPKRVSTQLPSNIALDTSAAGWSATTYGPTSYNKKRLRVTTPTAIKKDSLITMMVSCTAISSSLNDTLVICPDFVLSAP